MYGRNVLRIPAILTCSLTIECVLLLTIECVLLHKCTTHSSKTNVFSHYRMCSLTHYIMCSLTEMYYAFQQDFDLLAPLVDGGMRFICPNLNQTKLTSSNLNTK